MKTFAEVSCISVVSPEKKNRNLMCLLWSFRKDLNSVTKCAQICQDTIVYNKFLRSQCKYDHMSTIVYFISMHLLQISLNMETREVSVIKWKNKVTCII